MVEKIITSVNCRKFLKLVMFPSQYSRYTVLEILGTIEIGSKYWYLKSLFVIISTSLLHYLLFPIFFLYKISVEHFVIKKWIRQKKKYKNTGLKVCIYSPWFDRYGGGAEAVAAYMAQYFESYLPDSSVTILCDDFLGYIMKNPTLLEEINLKYDTNLINTSIVFKKHGYYSFFMYNYYLNFLRTSMEYDVFINCFINVNPSLANKNIHYLHFPETKNEAISAFMFDLYTSNIDLFIANSSYTFKWASKFLNPKRMITIEPPVKIYTNDAIPPKKNIIISAGRIVSEKNLSTLIDAFIQFNKNNKNWSYYIIGSKKPKNQKYFEQLTRQSKGYPISFYTNQNKNDYNDLLKTGTIFWHAMGYGTDLKETPQSAEHFGITTIEAMSYGCIPLVFDVGGPADVVKKNQCGYLWNTVDELVECTNKLSKDTQLMLSLSKKAKESAQNYDQKHFYEAMDQMLKELLINK